MNDFSALEPEVLVTFLRKSDLVVTDEFVLFQIVSKWLLNQELECRDNDTFNNLVPFVMSHVRFPMMTPRQLASLLIDPLVTRFQDFFVSQMTLAMRFHSNNLPLNVYRQLSVSI